MFPLIFGVDWVTKLDPTAQIAPENAFPFLDSRTSRRAVQGSRREVVLLGRSRSALDARGFPMLKFFDLAARGLGVAARG